MFRYNNLKDDSGQPEVTVNQLNSLAALFTRHDAQDVFGVHLVHGHFQIDEDMIMLGVDLGTDFPGYWTRPTKSTNVDTDSIHGHVYMLSENHFTPYEYRGGPSVSNWKQVHPSFFSELASYLATNDLAGVLGLQVLDRLAVSPERMLEFVLGGEGTAMLREQDVNHGGIYRVTGWSFGRDEDGIISVKGSESHAKTTKGTHQVFIDGKPLPTVEAVRDVLQKERII